ncbi:type II secretion system protein [Levilactobacillus bambusae]|uniref:type II secretion system protein n=1 Tax=Levilactobacillus bambusae TaxID=2024736 RepID=UPI001CDAD945|nr:type II secretion system protein [Levilactobacillus bambusae]
MRLYKNRGFTLIEMVIVLMITAGALILVGRPRLSVTEQQRSEKLFWESLSSYWLETRGLAIKNRERVALIFDERNHRVYMEAANGEVQKGITVPDSLHLTKKSFAGANVHFNADGWANPQTIFWQSQLTRQEIRLTVQLGGRVYYLKT